MVFRWKAHEVSHGPGFRRHFVSALPKSFNVDGEVIGDEPAVFEVLPRALEVVVGPEEET
jgi:diacylglycerol kinase family enzyme